LIADSFYLFFGGCKTSMELLTKCLLKAWFEPDGLEGVGEQDVPPDVPPPKHNFGVTGPVKLECT
jgi:hypothetical protein